MIPKQAPVVQCVHNGCENRALINYKSSLGYVAEERDPLLFYVCEICYKELFYTRDRNVMLYRKLVDLGVERVNSLKEAEELLRDV